MQRSGPDSILEGSVTNRELIARILRCPDCDGAVAADLRCSNCGRSFEPEPDGIISALPRTMVERTIDKTQLQDTITSDGPGEHGERVVLFEQVFHDEQAPHYDGLFADPLPLRHYYRHLVRDQIHHYVDGAPFVVDLCCGTGKSSIPLVERGLTVVGIDVSREMLRTYRSKCRDGRNPILIHADASRPPLRGNSCVALSMIGGLHHIPDREGALQACCDALAAGGLLILHEPLKTGKENHLGRLLENFYVVTDPVRVFAALRRRLRRTPPASGDTSPAPVADFTPYERPFGSIEELREAMPRQMRTLLVRSQGVWSFRQFAPYLQSPLGRPLASLIVRLDAMLSSGRRYLSGDALFAVFRKDPS